MPTPQKSITLILVSDTHSLHDELDMPAVAGESILIHAGDATMFSRPPSSIDRFNDWLGSLPYNHKVFVPGNHESYISEDLRRRTQLSNATVLINESATIAGMKIWGSPVTPLANTAFGMPIAVARRRVYSTIPDDTDILITHGAPFSVLDMAPGSNHHAGDPELLGAVQRVQPILHVFGHVHGAHGIEEIDDTLYVNAALLSPDGDIEQKPIVVRIAPK